MDYNNNYRGGGGPRRDYAPRPKVQGNWKCNGCGAEITELPFSPAPDRDIFCRDCWRNKRDSR